MENNGKVYRINTPACFVEANQAEIRADHRRERLQALAFALACLLLVAGTMYALKVIGG